MKYLFNIAKNDVCEIKYWISQSVFPICSIDVLKQTLHVKAIDWNTPTATAVKDSVLIHSSMLCAHQMSMWCACNIISHYI